MKIDQALIICTLNAGDGAGYGVDLVTLGHTWSHMSLLPALVLLELLLLFPWERYGSVAAVQVLACPG
jgi:hypothetical protein